ncbi:carbon-nitrogen hydrolase family protein [Deinococcus sp. SDU3-2]|uniref:Carbon-nitrogen hydrolase family protein n=1 Tax=Deinococcus terrestris TaxID=2651870 RepID=A0A7X1NV04_9DEIO|nr:carbon-nitrogen hydrolase family protein [Deinococcus terrestris]MPY65909.1 carbon-nitrogen hydrolase family protein [Deinococcus terrestris]
MKAALVVFPTAPDLAGNLGRIEAAVQDAALAGASLAVFAETALTGWAHTGRDADTDRPLALEVRGPELVRLREVAYRYGIWLAFGLLERDGDALYDAALLLDPQGETRLHFRRLSPGWRWPDAGPAYREGTAVPTAPTPFGRVAFLLCGDAFSPEAVALARAAQPDLLLLPFARGFDEDAPDAVAWQDEPQVYAEALAGAAPVTLAVNSLGAGMVGGAFVLKRGRVAARWPIQTPGLLLHDLNPEA